LNGRSNILWLRRAYGPVIRLLLVGVLASLPFTAWAAIELGKGDEPIIELAAMILGGIGIFLIGIHFAGEHFQQMAGGSFRNIVTKVSQRGIGMMVAGMFLGVFTQSGKAISFLLADFVQVSLLRVRQSGPIVFWGNVGSTFIVFASMLSIKVFALIALGVTALGLTFHVPKKLVHTYGALFGLAMIMYGLFLVKEGAGGLAGTEWVHGILGGWAGFYLPAFLAGLVLTLLIQSNLATTMIAIALASAGLLNLEESMMAMVGAQAGTGILTWVFSSHVYGRARQVVIGQVAFDVITTATFLVLFYLEVLLGIPVVLSFVRAVASELSGQVIVLAFGIQVVGALVLLGLSKWVFDYIEQKFPPSKAEVLSATQFLHDRAADNPTTALLLVEKEQLRLLSRLPAYIDYVRPETDTVGQPSPADYHEAFMSISQKIGSALTSLSRNSLSVEISDSLILITKSQEQIVALERYIFQLASDYAAIGHAGKAEELGRNILESVDFMMLAALDAIASKDSGEVEMLAMLTQDRTELMKKVRHNYFESEGQLSDEERNFVLDVTMCLENIVQTLAHYGRLLHTPTT
jgi:phosphate:Na+ symporter